MLTAEARAHIVRANQGFGVTRCENLPALFQAEASPDDLRELRRLKLGSVQVRGNRATATVVGVRSLEATGEETRLRRVDGRWLIDGSTA
jgi:hypothetical protein